MAASDPAQLQIIATGVYEHVLKDLAAPFTARTGYGVRFVITNAGGVITRLDANEAADVVMTSSAGIDSLAAKGKVDRATGYPELGHSKRPLRSLTRGGGSRPKVHLIQAVVLLLRLLDVLPYHRFVSTAA